MKIIKRVLLILFCCFLFVVLLFFGYYVIATKDAVLDEKKLFDYSYNVTVFDDFGTKIPSSSYIRKQRICLDELPSYVQHAFVDTEDKNFFTHHGFDYLRIAKAFIKNVGARSFKQGASTISQQLIKNTHLTHEKTLTRKFKEWKLTRQLEKRYTKNEILENYLSVIYFGHNCFGLASASQFYFGKTPATLTLGESCILAGLVKSPRSESVV